MRGLEVEAWWFGALGGSCEQKTGVWGSRSHGLGFRIYGI